MGEKIIFIYFSMLFYLLCPTHVTAFLASTNGQNLPIQCSYFSSFQDAVETIKRMQQHKEFLHLQVACNFAKMIVSLSISTDEAEYNKAITGSDAVDFHALQRDLEIIHNYRHNDCIKLIIGDLSIYLQTHQYDVCSQYKNEMSVHFSTDHINCLPQASCTQCSSGDSCVTADIATPCTNGERFCMTSVLQSKTQRKVVRKCSDEPECMLNHIGLSDCLLVDQGPLGFAYDCHFCCVGSNCNKGPQLIPPAHTHYNKTL